MVTKKAKGDKTKAGDLRSSRAARSGDPRRAQSGPDSDAAFDSQQTILPIPIPINELKPSPTNPRKKFDEAALLELAASIREVGLLQDLVVRPETEPAKLAQHARECGAKPRSEPTGFYEIVAGERRFRAAKIAGLKRLSCKVRELNDQQVVIIQQIENLQRADLDPYEEACGFQTLIEQGLTADAIAVRVGKSKAHIYGMLKLATDLPAKALDALQEGVISKSVAQLIARVPDAKLRTEATKEILSGKWRGEPMSFRDAQEWISRNCMTELKKAPFSLTQVDLVPDAGSCEECPKRAGNNPDLYPGTRADVCTDPACFRQKVKAHGQQLLKAAEESGKKILPKAECEKIFSPYNGAMEYNAPYLDLAAQCWEDTKRRSYKQLLEPHMAEEFVVAVNKDGKIHVLAPKARAKEVLRKEHKIGKREAARDDGMGRWRKEQADHRKKEKEQGVIAVRLVERAVEAVESKLTSIVGWSAVELQIVREIVAGMLEEVWNDHLRRIMSRRQIQGDKHSSYATDLARHAQTLSVPQCFGLLAEIVTLRSTIGYNPDKLPGFWAAIGVDRKQVEKEFRSELAAKAKTKKGKRQKATAAK